MTQHDQPLSEAIRLATQSHYEAYEAGYRDGFAHGRQLVRVDAIRWVPASFDPYQARVPKGNMFGDPIAISISRAAFQSLAAFDEALHWPGEWVMLPADARYWMQAGTP